MKQTWKIPGYAVLVAVLTLWSASLLAVQVGDKGTAVWHGKSYPAEITKIKGAQCFVHWIGESGSYDEWQACSAITVTEPKQASAPAVGGAYKEGDPVQVNWKGQWYPAHVIAVNPTKNTYKIHYDGYDNSWDEWVGTGRMKR